MLLKQHTKRDLALEIIIFALGIAFISVFYSRIALVSILLLALWAVGIIFWHTRQDILFFVAGAIIGPIGEIICIHYGAWQYTKPSFLGIPLWLPFAWGFATMLIKRIAETAGKLVK